MTFGNGSPVLTQEQDGLCYNEDGNSILLLLMRPDNVLQHPSLHGVTWNSHSPEITTCVYLWQHVREPSRGSDHSSSRK